MQSAAPNSCPLKVLTIPRSNESKSSKANDHKSSKMRKITLNLRNGAIASFAMVTLLGFYTPAYAIPDCDANPSAPICGGGNDNDPPVTIYTYRLHLQQHNPPNKDYVDFTYEKENKRLYWRGKTYTGCFSYESSYPQYYGGTFTFIRKFVMPWSQFCYGYQTISTDGSMSVNLSTSQLQNFTGLFGSRDDFRYPP